MSVAEAIRRHSFRLWGSFGFLGDAALLMTGGWSSNPFMAWAGLAGLLGAAMVSLFGNRARPVAAPLFLTVGLAMLLSGADTLKANDTVHPAQIVNGGLLIAAYSCLFYLGRRGPVFGITGPKLAAVLLFIATLSLLTDGLAQSGGGVLLAAICYIVSNVFCFLIRVRAKPAEGALNEA